MLTSETKSKTRGLLQRFRLLGGHHRKQFKKREMRDDPDITSSSGSSLEPTRCPQTTLAARSQAVAQEGQSLSSNELLELARSTHKESIAQGLALLQGMEDNAQRSLRRNQEDNWEDSLSMGLPVDQSFRSVDTPPTASRFDPTTSPFDARSSSKWAAIKPSSAPSPLAGGRGGSASATSNPHLHTGTLSTEVSVSLVVPRLLNTSSSAKQAW